MASKGFIQLIIGPMYAGKSTELLKIVNRYELANKKCLIVKSKIDNRYTDGNMIITHDK